MRDENRANDDPILHSEAFSPLPVTTRAVMMALPLVGLVLILFLVYVTSGVKGLSFLVITGFGGFVGAGKFVILLGVAKSAPVGLWGIAGIVVYGDLMAALFILANMQHLYRMPWAGKKLAALRIASYRVLQNNPWMGRAAFLGVSVFVMLPFQGAGSVLGVILARILGLSRASTIGAIATGTVVGCSALALLGSLWT